uniref:uncharacterized protein LOC109965474 isoform X2 n=1 Tax=Monopterus albus TaxID=43700 RepID=UPI0009B4354F|nr:uncharacterized protein LOC109965474 isoform X2 [Monopterus albus]
MARKRALTIPFTVEKNNLEENPLKIPVTFRSSQYGKLKRQVSWTAIAGCNRASRSQHKNGSLRFDRNYTAMVKRQMARTPCLVLRDVLKTEVGKTYIEKMKNRINSENRGCVTSRRRASGQCRREPLVWRETRSSQREAKGDKTKSETPKQNQKVTTSPVQRSKLRRKLLNADGDDEDNKEEKDIEEVIIGKDSQADCIFTEVVDCGLSVSWKPAEVTRGCDELSSASIEDGPDDAGEEVQHNLTRKRKDGESQCNGIGSPKRQRESELCLTEEDGRDGGPALAPVCLEQIGEDGDSENLDLSILQFTVGGDDVAEVVVPAISQNVETGDFISSSRQSHSSGQDNALSKSPPEPIVLSSDDEGSSDVPQHHSPAVHTLVTVEDGIIHRQPFQEAVAKYPEAPDVQDMQELHVVLADFAYSAASTPSDDYCMLVAFSALHCGVYQGKANGDIRVGDHKISIPLKDVSEQVEMILTFERKELRRYSVWEQEEMEAQELQLKGDEDPSPVAVLVFFVSETAAAAIQQDLCKLRVKQEETLNTGKASPFILLSLKDRLQGMEGALLRSLLDIECLNSLTHDQSQIVDKVSDWEETPSLTLDTTVELIRRTGMDSHLLSLLGLQTAEPGLNTNQDSPLSDTNTLTCTQLEVEPYIETVVELETLPEQDRGTQLDSEEEQKQQELNHPSEKRKEEPTPIYTLCHRRSKGSYSVSLCKPDSTWTKYKRQGLARRLIQFPPPPLKGGITVTMEDLQCLDSGHFLNDVIIDFYLKYLLQNTSAAVAERCHIFSSFFYKQLTRRDNASEGATSDSCQRQRRHQRVKTWTRHVDIFNKDFLFVPVNQEAHWYLVVICFPGMDEPKTEAWTGTSSVTKWHSVTGELQAQDGSKSPDDSDTAATLNHSDDMDTETENSQEETTKVPPPGPVNCTEHTCQETAVCKRPCILIMDSLKLSLHERVFKLLREYLQSEWEARRGSSRDFGPDQMKSSHCQVPLQDNSSDCGLYLLQYVESFLKDPVVHFDLPLNLEQWFARQQVRRKRDEIRDLVLNLYRRQNKQ